jgi:hypothetical protein
MAEITGGEPFARARQEEGIEFLVMETRPKARSAGTAWRRAWAALASTWTPSKASSRRCAAREHDGPSLVCLRTDHDANLAVPEEMMARFFEVYSGPVEEVVAA